MAQLEWQTVKEYEEITFKQLNGVARIAFNRPEVRNAFTPKTVDELWEALILCHESQEIGVGAYHWRGTVAERRWLGILLWRRPTRSFDHRI